jgi:predicted HicB family RNase H-like nuclease
MKKYNIPKRFYLEGDKKLFTIRIHLKLQEALQRHAKEKGYNLTELIELVLDQYLQDEDKE